MRIDFSVIIEEILCDVRRQTRSIVELCEEFSVRHYRAKFTSQNDFLHYRLDCISLLFQKGENAIFAYEVKRSNKE